MSEKLKFYKGLEENLVNITIELGAIYHCTDTGNTYIGVIDSEGEVLEDGTYPLKLDLYSTVSDIYIGDDDEIEGGFELVNADTLGGFPADEYALKSHVYEKIDEININSYATKEEVNALTYENVGAAPAGDYATKEEVNTLTYEDVGAAPAGDYATESFVTNKIAEAQLGGGDDTPTIDLSGYATKDDLNAIDFPVDSVNGQTGVVQLNADDLGALNLQHIMNTERIVPKGADLNTYTTPGAYRIASDTVTQSLKNAPPYTNTGFRLIVSGVSNTEGVVQFAIYNSVTNLIMLRVKNHVGTWGEWGKVLTQTDVPPLQQLWSGSWSSGTITVPDTDKYTLFQINISGNGTTVIAAKKDTHIRGIGGYSSAASNISTYHFTATFSGNTWTYVACNSLRHNPGAAHGDLSDGLAVVAIVGLR